MMIVPPVISNPPLTNSLLAVTKQHGSLQHRVLILDFALSRIQEHSLLGWGLDSSRSIPHGSERIVDTPDRMNVLDGSLFSVGVVRVGQNLPLHPHNNLIQVRLELGLPGVLVTVLAFFLIIRTIIRLPAAIDRSACLGTLAVVIVVASVSYGAWQTWWLASLVLTAFLVRIGLRLSGLRVPE